MTRPSKKAGHYLTYKLSHKKHEISANEIRAEIYIIWGDNIYIPNGNPIKVKNQFHYRWPIRPRSDKFMASKRERITCRYAYLQIWPIMATRWHSSMNFIGHRRA